MNKPRQLDYLDSQLMCRVETHILAGLGKNPNIFSPIRSKFRLPFFSIIHMSVVLKDYMGMKND